jgi:hypothetical protein
MWLNDPAVRRAIHAAPIRLTTPWVICSDRIEYTHDMGSMIPYHKKLTQEKGEFMTPLLASPYNRELARR